MDDSMDRGSMEHWLSMVDSMMDRSMNKGGSMVDRSMMNRGWCIWFRFWHIFLGHSFIFHIGNKPVLMVSMVGNDLHTTIGQLYTVLAFDNSCGILGLSLGEMSSIGISTSILISKRLGWQLFLVVWCWMRSGVVGSRGGVVRSRGGFVRSRGGFVGGWCGFVWGRGWVVWLSLWVYRGSFV